MESLKEVLCLCLKVIHIQRLPDLNTHALVIIASQHSVQIPGSPYILLKEHQRPLWTGTAKVLGDACVWLRPNISCGNYSVNAQTGPILKASLESDYDQALSGTGIMIRGHFDLLKPFEKCSRYKHKSKRHIPSKCAETEQTCFPTSHIPDLFFFSKSTLTAPMVHIFVLYTSDA